MDTLKITPLIVEINNILTQAFSNLDNYYFRSIILSEAYLSNEETNDQLFTREYLKIIVRGEGKICFFHETRDLSERQLSALKLYLMHFLTSNGYKKES